METSTNLKSLVLMTAISTAIVPFNYQNYDKIAPTTEVAFNFPPDKSWHYNSISKEDSYLNVLENEKIGIIMNFSQDLIDNSTELDAEFIQIVNNNFWDLL